MIYALRHSISLSFIFCTLCSSLINIAIFFSSTEVPPFIYFFYSSSSPGFPDSGGLPGVETLSFFKSFCSSSLRFNFDSGVLVEGGNLRTSASSLKRVSNSLIYSDFLLNCFVCWSFRFFTFRRSAWKNAIYFSESATFAVSSAYLDSLICPPFLFSNRLAASLCFISSLILAIVWSFSFSWLSSSERLGEEESQKSEMIWLLLRGEFRDSCSV